MNYKLFIINTLTILYFLKVVSQEGVDSTQINNLEEVILTVTRTERQFLSLLLPVTLISKKKILQSGTIRLNEILSE
jgi:outer membrane receptor for ferrienterochelin and colicins